MSHFLAGFSDRRGKIARMLKSVGRQVRPNLPHLEARMRQSRHWSGKPLTLDILHNLLLERFEKIAFRNAAEEVRPFLPDPRELELWLQAFFDALAERLCGA